MSKIIATILLTLGLLASSSAAALACGDTPGFCPNPPATHKPMDYPQCYAPKSPPEPPLPF